MKIAICDDEELCCTEVLSIIKEYSEQHAEQQFAFSAFSCGEDLLEAAGKIGGYDVYILDIVMPYMNGIDLGVALRRRGYDGRIIYLTSSKEYAIDSFRAKPYNYILKPFDRITFCKALDDALASLFEQKNKAIIIKTQESIIKLDLYQILYAELHRRVITYHLFPESLPVDETELATVFANTIENAIHACEKIEADKRRIDVKVLTSPRFMLQISNSYDGIVEVDENGTPVSREEGHGFGTRSIVAFCNKNHAYYEFKADSELFRLRISF